ncbi:MAG: DoxX family protein [Sandaracinaceae bacterium]
MLKTLLNTDLKWASSLGLLLLRIGIASMMLFGHGIPKLGRLPGILETFPDPLGVGNATSFVLAIVGEVVAPALLIVGLGTRLAAVPLLITMVVAFVIVHAGDPYSDRELAMVYALCAVTLLFAGPGAWSLDGLIQRRRNGGATRRG